ncbi:hypothetical protein N657DRAFT_13390 [Parathielavia appendiculata]|uniref:Uncharacterized protein n=1 Tax=Parathielavia appendiculata TaxID=2587402 RepID=A0AAN6Z8L2_9PEZI|nr:hypothetical protein N657DRAFT_13390 [Parathielavia appendiculata]
MPKFPFGRRKSTADNLENATVTGPSFRVLERNEVVGSKPFDGGVRHAAATHAFHKTTGSDLTVEDNIFADLKSNRGSGSSNTTKTTLTDNSSRHSNASTAPSSADTGGSDEWRSGQRKLPVDIPVPPIPKSSSGGFLKAAGRTFSFGGQKKQLPPPPTIHESPPSSPIAAGMQTPAQVRPRATTSSTSTTVTPPRVEDDFDLDLGGDFGKMCLGNDKRASVATVRNNQPYSAQMPAPRSLTGARPIQPSPIHIDKTTTVEPPAHSWSSQHSNDQLIGPSSPSLSPTVKNNAAPLIARHSSPLLDRQRSEISPEVGPSRPLLASQRSNSVEDVEDEEARLLKDSLSTVTRFIHGADTSSSSSAGRYRRDESSLEGDSDSLFDSSPAYSSKYGSRYPPRKAQTNTPGSNKVMTPEEFEKYRQDKERQDRERRIIGAPGAKTGADEDEEDNYEDDEDDAEKAKQQAKQRRKQEAHMAVYRQQMMKITGESAGSAPSFRPSLQMSFSTPNLPNGGASSGGADTAEDPEEDEETPLAYLAAAGFPNKNRPPNRLSTMGSNPNLRAAMQPSYQRPVSVVGDGAGAGNPRLPAFARNLPTDPFLGAGLVRNPVRESFALGGGSPAPGQPGTPVPPGGLIGVIANEERARAMRRGSPHLPDGPSLIPGAAGFDPVAGIPSHLMYQARPSPAMLSPGDQAQIQMTHQMQQFMQMQMQFMQMMSGQNGNPPAIAGGLLTSPSAGNLSTTGGLTPSLSGPEMRHSFVGNGSMLDSPFGRGESQMRTMSMVQPSSASWIQPTQPASFAPSIRMQGGVYAPSIAPSERSNIGLPGRYRPVSHVPPAPPATTSNLRKSSTMSGAIQISVTKAGNASDDDDEGGWEAMKAKREKKKSMWRSKKSGSVGDDIGAMIN